jgi:hypothetical protein
MRNVLALLVYGVLVSAPLVAQTSERLKLVARYAKDLKSRDAAKRAGRCTRARRSQDYSRAHGAPC